MDSDQFILNNVNNYNLANITASTYVFSNIVSGDPYRIVADVFDKLDFKHSLTNVKLGDPGSDYFWPTDDVSGLDFTLETEASGIQYEIKYESIRSDEIPVFIHSNISDMPGYQLQYDFYAEPVNPYTYKKHNKKKYITNDIANIDDTMTRYYMGDLDTLVGYNIFYSLKVKPPGETDWYYLNAHTPVAENVVTIDPGFRVDLVPIEQSSVESVRFRRIATDFFHNRYLNHQIEEMDIVDYITQ